MCEMTVRIATFAKLGNHKTALQWNLANAIIQ